jgi:hypothetical protein
MRAGAGDDAAPGSTLQGLLGVCGHGCGGGRFDVF